MSIPAMRVQSTELKIIQRAVPVSSGAKGLSYLRVNDQTSERSLRRSFYDIFSLARSLKERTVRVAVLIEGQTFPLIGVSKIASQEILRLCRACPAAFTTITLILPDRPTFNLFEKQVFGYIRHVQEDLGLGPYVTVDMIIERPDGLVLIERSNPPYGLALPGGFVDNGESLEHAARRETKEETHLDLVDLRQFHTYSDPKRDPRFHTISTVFIGKGRGKPRFGDDAKGLTVVPYQDLLKYDYAFDHKQIIKDYLQWAKTRRA